MTVLRSGLCLHQSSCSPTLSLITWSMRGFADFSLWVIHFTAQSRTVPLLLGVSGHQHHDGWGWRPRLRALRAVKWITHFSLTGLNRRVSHSPRTKMADVAASARTDEPAADAIGTEPIDSAGPRVRVRARMPRRRWGIGWLVKVVRSVVGAWAGEGPLCNLRSWRLRRAGGALKFTRSWGKVHVDLRTGCAGEY